MSRARRSRAVMSACCIAPFCLAMALRDAVNVWVSTTAAACIAIPLAVSEMQSTSAPWWKRTDWRLLLLGLGVGLLMALATWTLYPLSVSLIPQFEEKVGWLYGVLRQPPGPSRALPFLLAVVLAEELVWRGILMDWLIDAHGARAAVIGSALLYVLPQVAFRSMTLIAVAFACGLVWGGLRVTTRSIWPPLIAHLVWDILVFIVYPVA